MNRQLRLVMDNSGDLSIREVLYNETREAQGCSSEATRMSACSKFELIQRLKLALELATTRPIFCRKNTGNCKTS